MQAQWMDVLGEEELNDPGGREVVVDGKLIALFHVGGEWFAIDGTCPHHGGPLGQGELCEGMVQCPWHGLQVDIRSGAYVLGEPHRLTTFPTRCRAGRVEVCCGESES